MAGLWTPELVGSVIAAIVPSATYAWRVWVARKERAEQRAAILAEQAAQRAAIERHADNPAVLAALARLDVSAALAKLDVPSADLRGPTALLLVAAAAGTLAANATIAAPLVGVELPSQALGASLGKAPLPARCLPSDCRPPAYCAGGICQAEARPPEPPPPAPAAPAPAPSGSGQAARPHDEALGPRSGYARVPWAETLPGRWSPFLREDGSP